MMLRRRPVAFQWGQSHALPRELLLVLLSLRLARPKNRGTGRIFTQRADYYRYARTANGLLDCTLSTEKPDWQGQLPVASHDGKSVLQVLLQRGKMEQWKDCVPEPT